MKLFGDVPVRAGRDAGRFHRTRRRDRAAAAEPRRAARRGRLEGAGRGCRRKYSISAEELEGCAAGAEGRGAGRATCCWSGPAMARSGTTRPSTWRRRASRSPARCGPRIAASWPSAPTTCPGTCPDERDPETGATLFAHVYLLPAEGDLHHREPEPGRAGPRPPLRIRVRRHPAQVPGSDGLAAAAAGGRLNRGQKFHPTSSVTNSDHAPAAGRNQRNGLRGGMSQISKTSSRLRVIRYLPSGVQRQASVPPRMTSRRWQSRLVRMRRRPLGG